MKHEPVPPQSFALEYRKRLLAEQQDRAPQAPRRTAFIAMPPADPEATAANRGRVFGALVVAGLVLAVFNSEGLTHWARGLSETAAGRQVFAWSMQWHGMMETASTHRLVAGLRHGVASARAAAWEDVAAGLGLGASGDGAVKNAASRGDAAGAITGSIPAPPPAALRAAGR